MGREGVVGGGPSGRYFGASPVDRVPLLVGGGFPVVWLYLAVFGGIWRYLAVFGGIKASSLVTGGALTCF